MRLSADNPMRGTMSLTLIFEAIVCVLAVPGMIQVSDVATGTALAAGLVAAVLCVLAGFTLRRAWGWVLAWAAQAACVALGVLTPWMYWVGGAFALLFSLQFVLGRRLAARQ